MTAPANPPRETVRPLVIGLGLALTLTAIAFALVWTGTLTGRLGLAALAVLAGAQMLVHLRFFLHLGKGTQRGIGWGIVFVVVLLVILLGGTFWIMTDLNSRMMSGLEPTTPQTRAALSLPPPCGTRNWTQCG